jgi:hypothetical protein
MTGNGLEFFGGQLKWSKIRFGGDSTIVNILKAIDYYVLNSELYGI